MSLTHYIKPKKKISIRDLIVTIIETENAKHIEREDSHYFWIDQKSTRGVDLTFEEGQWEVRNTFLSNSTDYLLAKGIISTVAEFTKGQVYNGDLEKEDPEGLFTLDSIQNMNEQDCDILKVLVKEEGDVTIYGPKRSVSFGKRVLNRIESLENESFVKAVFDLILEVNFGLPYYPYGQLISVTENDEKKVMVFLSNREDCIIPKCDSILLLSGKDKVLKITNKILNDILPSSWKLIDEYIIVAMRLDNREWRKLISDARRYDLSVI